MPQLSLMKPGDPPPALVLRPYQEKAIEEVRGHIKTGKKRILCCAMTGAGKTVLFAAICAMAHQKGSRTLIVAHRVELINQTVAMLERAGIPSDQIGVHCGNHPRRNDSAPHQVASVQTLLRRDIPPADILVIDECKHCTDSNSYGRVVKALPNAILIGFDATPIRMDGRGLGEIFEVIVIVSKPSYLIAQGYLVSTKVLEPTKSPNLSKIHTRGGEYDTEELEVVCNTTELRGDIVQTYLEHSKGVRALCFAVTIKHSKELVADFLKEGVPAEHVDGETPAEVRAAIFARFLAGETLVVSNVGIAGEGTDLPACKTIIMARPTKSLALYIQMCGRAMRPDPSNPGLMATVLDHVGNCRRFGEPEKDHPWSLELNEIKGSGEPPMKRCDRYAFDETEEPGHREAGCLGLSPTGCRYCRWCDHPFYPRCPRCKPRFNKKGVLVSECHGCRKGITPIDMDSPPAMVTCQCCGVIFVPFRDLIVGREGKLRKKEKPPIHEQQGPTDPLDMPEWLKRRFGSKAMATPAQVAWLKRADVAAEKMTKLEASKAIEKIQKRRQMGLCTLKQSKLLERFGLNPDLTFEEAQLVLRDIAACNWHVPDDIAEKYKREAGGKSA